METPAGDGVMNLLTDDEEEEEEKPEAQASPGPTQPGPGSRRRVTLHPLAPVTPAVELSAILTGVELAGAALLEEQKQRERGRVLKENQRLFTEFVDFCRTLTEENPEVINFLEKKYNKAFADYVSSTEFRNVLGRCLTRVQSKRSKVYVYIKELCTALKANSQKTKAALMTGRNRPPVGSSPATEGPSDQPEAPDSTGKRSGGGSRRQIRYLENLLSVYNNEIRRLQEKELDLSQLEDEDSIYIQEHRLKKKMVKIFQKLCELKSCSSLTGRVIEQHIVFTGTRYPEINRRIERFINKPDNFPDYQDIRNLITKVNVRHSLGLGQRHIHSMAQDTFREVGNRLQERRHLDLVYNFGSHLTDDYKPGEDPALIDTGLDKCLKTNRTLAMSHLDDVVKKYAGIQDVSEIEEEERRRQKKLLQAASTPATEPEPTAQTEPSSTTSPTPAPDSTDAEVRVEGGKPEEGDEAVGSDQEDAEAEEEEEEEEDEDEEDDLSSDPDIEEELAKIPEEAEGDEEALEEEKADGSEAKEGEPSDESPATSDKEESGSKEEAEEDIHCLNGSKEEDESEGGVSANGEHEAGVEPPGDSGLKGKTAPLAAEGSGDSTEPVTATTTTETGSGSTSEGRAVIPPTEGEGQGSENGGGGSDGASPLTFDHKKAKEAREVRGLSLQDTKHPSPRRSLRGRECQSPHAKHRSEPGRDSPSPTNPQESRAGEEEEAMSTQDEPCPGKRQERHSLGPDACLTAVNGRKREPTNRAGSSIAKRFKREVGAQDCSIEVIELMESDEGSEELAGSPVMCAGVKSSGSQPSSVRHERVNVATQCDPEEIIILSDSD